MLSVHYWGTNPKHRQKHLEGQEVVRAERKKPPLAPGAAAYLPRNPHGEPLPFGPLGPGRLGAGGGAGPDPPPGEQPATDLGSGALTPAPSSPWQGWPWPLVWISSSRPGWPTFRVRRTKSSRPGSTEKGGCAPDLIPLEDPSFRDSFRVLRNQAPYHPLNLTGLPGPCLSGRAHRGGGALPTHPSRGVCRRTL